MDAFNTILVECIAFILSALTVTTEAQIPCNSRSTYSVDAYLHESYHTEKTWIEAVQTCLQNGQVISTDRSLITDCVRSRYNSPSNTVWNIWIWGPTSRGECYFFQYSRFRAQYRYNPCTYTKKFICQDDVQTTTFTTTTTPSPTTNTTTTTTTDQTTVNTVTPKTENTSTSEKSAVTFGAPSDSTEGIIPSLDEDTNIYGGVIAGAIVGLVVGCLMIAVTVIVFKRRKQLLSKKQETDPRTRRDRASTSSNPVYETIPDEVEDNVLPTTNVEEIPVSNYEYVDGTTATLDYDDVLSSRQDTSSRNQYTGLDRSTRYVALPKTYDTLQHKSQGDDYYIHPV